jgi:uncharacterized protein YndB with AHSA1/START domain
MSNVLEVAPQGEREIAFTRVFDAPRHPVFEAWTRPDLLERWLYGPDEWPLAVCEIDLRVGGAARFVWHHRDGKRHGNERRLSRDRAAVLSLLNYGTRTGPAARQW